MALSARPAAPPGGVCLPSATPAPLCCGRGAGTRRPAPDSAVAVGRIVRERPFKQQCADTSQTGMWHHILETSVGSGTVKSTDAKWQEPAVGKQPRNMFGDQMMRDMISYMTWHKRWSYCRIQNSRNQSVNQSVSAPAGGRCPAT